MRETLKILSMRPSIYGLSYFITQSIFSLLTALVVSLTMCLLGILNFGEFFVFLIAVTFYGLAMIFKSMAISTLFSDSKVAGQIGSLILIAPLALFMWLISVSYKNENPKYMYCGYMVPFVPLVIALSKLFNSEFVPDAVSDSLSGPITWVALILSLPFYYGLYVYLDAIIPDTYGISKSLCFCFKKRRYIVEETKTT